MLYKNILKDIPPTPLDKMKLGKKKYLAVAQIISDKKCGKVLVMDIYKRVKPRTLILRFYCDKENYQVYDVEKDKWMRRNPSIVLAMYEGYTYCYPFRNDFAAASEETCELLKDFFNSKYIHQNCLGHIDEFVRELNTEKSNKARIRKRERIDSLMGLFPKLPKDFKIYLKTEVFKHYIFMDKLVNGIKPGRCSACGRKVKLPKGTKHKSTVICPKCGAETIAFESRYIESIKEEQTICVAHKVDEQLIIRWLTVYAGWYVTKNGQYAPSYKTNEYSRTMYLSSKGQNTICSFNNKNVWPYGQYWREQKTYIQDDLAYVYSYNLREVFGDTYYNIDFESELRKNNRPLHFVKLLDNLKNLPATEYLVKMGMYRIASEIDSDDLQEGGHFGSILGVNPQYKQMYIKLNISKNEHDLIKASNAWVNEAEFLKMRQFKLKPYQNSIVCKMLETMSYKRFVSYFTRQRAIYPKIAFEHILQWYRDYIQMSEQMDIDLSHKSVRFPKDIKVAHDRLLKEFKLVETQIYDEQLKRASKNLYAGLTEYKSNGFAIVFPKTRSEFIIEGQSLNHCVGTQEMYFNNHLKGERMIFFIRHENEIDKPFVTMEIDMRRLTILQIYGYGDKRPAQEVINFANKFLTQLKRRESEEMKNAS